MAEAALRDRELAVRVSSHKERFFPENDANRAPISYQLAVDGGLVLVPEGFWISVATFNTGHASLTTTDDVSDAWSLMATVEYTGSLGSLGDHWSRAPREATKAGA